MATTESGLLRAAGRLARRERRRDQARVPDARARAPPGRLERARRRRAASATSPRRTRCSPIPSDARRTTASGRPASSAAASSRCSRTSGASRTCSPRSSARTCSAAGGEAALAARRRRPGRRRDRARGCVRRCVGRRRRSTSALPCERCGASGAEPGTSTRYVPDVRRAPASCDASRRTSSASSSSSGRARTAAARARRSSSRATTAREKGRVVHAAAARRGRFPKGIHDGQQIRLRGEGHAGFRSGERGNAFVVVRVRPDPRFVRDGDDLHTALRLTMTDAALGTTATCPSLSGDLELEVPPGTQPGEVRVLKGEGMPSLRGARRGSSTSGSTWRCRPRSTTSSAAPRGARREARRRGLRARSDEDEGFFRRLKSALR